VKIQAAHAAPGSSAAGARGVGVRHQADRAYRRCGQEQPAEEVPGPRGDQRADQGERERDRDKGGRLLISGLEEHDDAQDRDERERDGHTNVDPRIGPAQPVPADREPVHSVGGEGQRRHV
jgi:hypothetical protein